MTILSVDGLSKSYGALRVIDGLSLSLAEGETLGVLGPNGAGKTTLLSIIAGTQTPSSGEVSGPAPGDGRGRAILGGVPSCQRDQADNRSLAH